MKGSAVTHWLRGCAGVKGSLSGCTGVTRVPRVTLVGRGGALAILQGR